ncbi:MAG TPA: hypothetical protein VKV20_00860 [Ktedonobacteraceae bacterium]|jgi:hypothetical protein|nr:hypothetical protein [Ktedonobacteraceae bacterium]
MSKIKMRCTTCGKWFQSANAKEVTCPDCLQKARKEKMAAKSTPPATSRPADQGVPGATGATRPAPAPKPKSVPSETSRWFDSVQDIKVGEPDSPQRPRLPFSPAPRDNRSGSERMGNRGPGGYRDDRGLGGYREDRGPGGYRDDRGMGGYREGSNRGPGVYREDRGPGGYRDDRGNRGPGGYREDRGPGGYRVGGASGIGSTIGQRPRQPLEGGYGRGPRPKPPGEPHRDRFPGGNRGGRPEQKVKKPRPAAPPKPKREKIPPPKPFVPTEEQVKQVEERYLELATPTEFDGIRTQISKELGIPKKAVKKIVKELRDRQGIPSWWEMQTYKGDSEELAKIKAAYEPYLPLPPVGVHKTIADELGLKPGIVYQAIKAIRLEMNLPQYNDPALHGLELQPKKKKTSTEDSTPGEESKAEQAASLAEAASSTGSAEGAPMVVGSSDGEASIHTGMAKGVDEVATPSEFVAATSNVTQTADDNAGSASDTEHVPGTPESSEVIAATLSDGGVSQAE